MRDVAITVVALLVGTLSVTTILQLHRLHRKVDTIDAHVRRSEQRRDEAREEVHRLLGDDDLPRDNGRRKRRHHLRSIPVVAALSGATAGLLTWARKPLLAAAGATVATATAVAILSIPGGRSDDAMPEPPRPPTVLPDSTTTGATTSTTFTPALSTSTTTTLPTVEPSTPSAAVTGDRPDVPPPPAALTSPGGTPAMPAPTSPHVQPEKPNTNTPRACTLRLDLLDAIIELCSTEGPAA